MSVRGTAPVLPILIVGLVLGGSVGCADEGADDGYLGLPSDTIQLPLQQAQLIAGGSDDPLHEVAGAIFLGNQIVVAEQGGSIRFYDQGGVPLGRTGGVGEGPGEFQSIEWIQAYPGGVAAFDRRARRITVLDPDGALRFTFSPTVEGYEITELAGVFSDGSFLARSLRDGDPDQDEGVYRFTWTLHRLDADESLLDSLGVYRGGERYTGQAAGVFVAGRLPYGKESFLAVSGMQFWVIENDEPCVLRLDVQGGESDRHCPDGVPTLGAVSEDDFAVMRERWARDNVPGAIDYGEILDEIGTADSFPWFGWEGERDLGIAVADAEGGLWLLHFGGVREIEPIWRRLDGLGKSRGWVTSMEDAEILDARGDELLVRRWDALDQETVELVRLPPE